MAKEKRTGEIVALKKVRMDNEKEGFPITAIREIKILKSLNHQNIVKLKEIVTSKAHESNQNKGSIYMVFEYMDHDLTGLADRPGVRFTAPQIKCYMMQLLKGLHYCHVHNVLHRDIKGSNLLIDNKGILKLADFGLARPWGGASDVDLTNRVITLWYRPLELLLGATKYGSAIDMWSVGCIFAELLVGKPVLAGKNEMEQVNLIFKLCGSPTEDHWPEAQKLKYFHMFKPERPFKRRVREEFSASRCPNVPPAALDLIDKLLCLDPSKRLSAKEALQSDYFWTDPLPCEPGDLPKYEPSHEFPMKKRKQEMRQREREEHNRRHQHQHNQSGHQPGVGGGHRPSGMPHAGGMAGGGGWKGPGPMGPPRGGGGYNPHGARGGHQHQPPGRGMPGQGGYAPRGAGGGPGNGQMSGGGGGGYNPQGSQRPPLYNQPRQGYAPGGQQQNQPGQQQHWQGGQGGYK